MTNERCANSEAEIEYQRDQDVFNEMSEAQVNDIVAGVLKGWNNDYSLEEIVQSNIGLVHTLLELTEGETKGPAANFYNELFNLVKDEVKNDTI